MKKFQVRVTDLVHLQIDEQVVYIAKDSVDRALAWEERLLAFIDWLGEFHGHALDEFASEQFGSPVRKVVFEQTYLLHYVIDEGAGVVRVVNFRHGARLPEFEGL